MVADNAPTPSESAPSYDELFADHPVNQQAPSGSSRAYAPVSQGDNHEEQHYHSEQDPEANGSSETPLQTLAGGSKPHVHCESCDSIAHRRERHDKEKHCCTMVAVTFIMAFVCLMVTGIVAAARLHA